MLPRATPGLALLRMTVAESAANTLTEGVSNTPVEPASRTAMRIWRIVWEHPVVDPQTTPPAADSFDTNALSMAISTRQDLTALPSLDALGSLALLRWAIYSASAPADAGISVAAAVIGSYVVDFGPLGLLVATRELSIYVQGTALPSASRASAVVYYSLEQLDPTEFFSLISVVEEL